MLFYVKIELLNNLNLKWIKNHELEHFWPMLSFNAL